MIKEWLKDLARLNLPVYLCETDSMKVVYAGYSSVKKKYFVRLMLGRDYNETILGRRWYWKIPDLLKCLEYDMAVSETGRISLDRFHKCDGYVLPVWAPLKINIDRPMDDICPSRMSHFAHIKRRIRKYNLTYEILTDNESFNNFIESFYKPYITKRHGEEAVIGDLHKVWEISPYPFLLGIKENGVLVAASLNEKSGNTVHLINLGLLDGDEEYLRHGAIGALYYFGILSGQEMGCKVFDAGATRPFINDGLTKYKISWGAEFVSEYSRSGENIWFGVNECSSEAREFLSNNPFMYFDEDHKLVKHGT
jgi:hypothetical protein